MITKLNEKAMLRASEDSFRIAIIRKINQIATEINHGTVWDNRVKAERDADRIYSDMPLSVTAEMVDEEYTNVMSELGLDETEE